MESVFGKQPPLARNAKMFLCQKYTDEKLKDIGTHFGIGESGISQASRRVNDKIRRDKKLKRNVMKIEKKLNMSRMKTRPLWFFRCDPFVFSDYIEILSAMITARASYKSHLFLLIPVCLNAIITAYQ